MRRREVPRPDDGVPGHLREFDPERYRRVAVTALQEHPGNAWAAAVAVWRAWQDEAIDWQAARGIVWGMKGWTRQLGPGRPPLGWVRDEFGVPGDVGTSPCPPRCRTHHRRGRRR